MEFGSWIMTLPQSTSPGTVTTVVGCGSTHNKEDTWDKYFLQVLLVDFEFYKYTIISFFLEIDHRLCKAPKPIPNFEAKSLLARLVLPWGTRWESRVLISILFFCPPSPPFPFFTPLDAHGSPPVNPSNFGVHNATQSGESFHTERGMERIKF